MPKNAFISIPKLAERWGSAPAQIPSSLAAGEFTKTTILPMMTKKMYKTLFLSILFFWVPYYTRTVF